MLYTLRMVAVLVWALVGYVAFITWPAIPKPREYPAYCFNDTDNFKSDVCSKIGKQWSL